MNISEQEIRSIVESVLGTVDMNSLVVSENGKERGAIEAGSGSEKDTAVPVPWNGTGVFDGMDIAIDAAERAQLALIGMTLEKRREIIQGVRKTVCDNLDEMARMAVEETGLGRYEDKVIKTRLAAVKTVRRISPARHQRPRWGKEKPSRTVHPTTRGGLTQWNGSPFSSPS